MATRPKR